MKQIARQNSRRLIRESQFTDSLSLKFWQLEYDRSWNKEDPMLGFILKSDETYDGVNHWAVACLLAVKGFRFIIDPDDIYWSYDYSFKECQKFQRVYQLRLIKINKPDYPKSVPVDTMTFLDSKLVPDDIKRIILFNMDRF